MLNVFARQLQFQGNFAKHDWECVSDNIKSTVYSSSVSASPNHRKDVFRMAEFLQEELKAVGAVNIQTVDPGKQNFEGTELPLPPIVLATVGTDPSKKTVLVYGHYDVQPVRIDGSYVKTRTVTDNVLFRH